MSVTYSQLRQLVELTGGEKSNGIQRLVESGGLIKKIAKGEISQATVGAVNPFAVEQVEPAYFYPEGYTPLPVEKQVEALCQRLGDLDASKVADLARAWDLAAYPQADGLYVVPKPASVAKLLGIEKPYAEGWGTLLEQGPLAALAAARAFRNWREGQLTPDRFRITREATEALLYLEYIQPGDFLVYPAQTGRLYAGYSSRNARWEIRHAEEPCQWQDTGYGVGWKLFANPHRLTRYEDLGADCPGDEFRAEARDEFDDCPYFHWNGGELHFDADWGGVGGSFGFFGSASAFR